MNLDWPPPYTVRRSQRAKRINIRICPSRGLELVLPEQASKVDALSFLECHKDWVTKHQNLWMNTNQKPIVLPEKIFLSALRKQWKVRYESVTGYKKIKLITLPQELVLYGEHLSLKNCLDELNEWLYLIAEIELRKWMNELSVVCQLPFNRLSVRNQTTRWGSCSYNKNISLNLKLLFLPKELTHYVLIHELCHTRYLDHSKKFWELVGSFLPNYKNSMLELKKIKWSNFPNWIKA